MVAELKLLTRGDVAEILGCSVRNVDFFVKRGELRPVKVGHLVRFTREELERFIAELMEVRASA